MGLTITEWRGEEVKKLMAKNVDQKLTICGVLIVNDIKEHLNVEGAGFGADGNLVYGQFPSEPGEDPHKQHGNLIRSITYNVDLEKKTLRVGSSSLIGKFLELGTKKMAARPFLRNAWARAKDKILSVFRGS